MDKFTQAIDDRIKFQKQLVAFGQDYINENPKSDDLIKCQLGVYKAMSIIDELEMILTLAIPEYGG